MRDLIDPLRVAPGSTVKLPRDFDPGHLPRGMSKASSVEILQRGVELLAEYQYRLAAQGTHGVLVVLQALDAGGKDGTIRHVMSGVNPQGVKVVSFKQPSADELDHDFLWRHVRALPARGEIGIFNRSHYEEVLVDRVHPELLERERLPSAEIDEDFWNRRYRQINQWEQHLVDNGVRVVKIFLNLSFDEQRKRFLERIDNREKNWKFSAADARERQFWPDYQKAYAEMLSHTSTPWAPWYVVPADHKWFARLAAGAVIADALMAIDPEIPAVSDQARAELAEVRVELEAEITAADRRRARR